MRMQRPCHAAGVAPNRQWFCPFLFLNLFLHVSRCSCKHTHTYTCQHTCNTNPEYLALQTVKDHRLCRFCANVMPIFVRCEGFLSRSGVDAGALRFGNGVDSSMLFSMAPSPFALFLPVSPTQRVDPARHRHRQIYLFVIAAASQQWLSTQKPLGGDWVPDLLDSKLLRWI